MLLIVFRIMHNMTAAGSGLDHHRILTAPKPNTDSLHKLNQRLLWVWSQKRWQCYGQCLIFLKLKCNAFFNIWTYFIWINIWGAQLKPYQLNLIKYLNIIMLILLHIFNMMEEIFKVYQMIKYLSTQYGVWIQQNTRLGLVISTSPPPTLVLLAQAGVNNNLELE